MFLSKVLSYKGAWDSVSDINQAEINEALKALDDYVVTVTKRTKLTPRDLWSGILGSVGWESHETFTVQGLKRPINMRMLGPTKNGISVTLPLGLSEFLSRWLFQHSAIAVKHRVIRVPVLLIPMANEFRLHERDTAANMVLSRTSFEMIQSQLDPLTPLTHPYPFLILGFSRQRSLNGPEIIELAEASQETSANRVIDRFIEFPPEYHQAGLGILNYFGTYLREQYPDEDAKVKIEQHGLTVRMVIETAGGRSEIVEKALHEYELIVTGQAAPQRFTDNEKLILELKTELRIAQVRIESQQDILSIQNTRIERLLGIVGDGLSNKQAIYIDFRPTVSATNSVHINNYVSSAIDEISELKDLLPVASMGYAALNDLQNSLESIESQTDPEIVRKSPAMSKFRRLIENVTEAGSTLKQVIDTTERGWEVFKDLAGKYNSIAEWCGLPQVPSVFTK